ncbi:GntP family permease [Rothia sp. AR01]|uniref:GntP family permease n=1 Tax=Rothia santali TaxID=2949643 RepID=A0A9X2KJL3_9MICC|nr:SLC13 family permease [Rothia santali]MCP3426984.1 GntP family permease [Rothia santali]
MFGNPVYLVGLLFASIALLIFLINWKTKLHPFLALLVVSLLTALAAGEHLVDIPETLIDGAGGTLGETGVVVALGAMLGRLLADSGAVRRIADLVVEHSSPKTAPWIMTAVSFVVGIPMFFEVGLVVLMPVIYSVAVRLEKLHDRPKMWYLRILIPAIAALSCLHGMVPPHPGPLIAVDGLGADVGLTILLGLICAVPTVILAGPVYAKFIAPLVRLEPSSTLIEQYTGTSPEKADDAGAVRQTAGAGARSAGADSAGDDAGSAPGTGGDRGAGSGSGAAASSASPSGPGAAGAETEKKARQVPTWMAFVCVLVPVVLMLVHAVVVIIAPESPAEAVAEAIGNPVVAMIIGVVFAAVALGMAARMNGEQIRSSFGSSLGSIAGVILIIAGGGAFNQVLKDSGIGDAMVSATSHLHMNLIVLGWLIGIILSFATGSATVGIVSATGIVAPLVTDESSMFISLIVIAIGSGSIGLNWVNHAGFWFVKESFGMTLGEATKTHMTVQTLVSVFGLAFALLLSLLA